MTMQNQKNSPRSSKTPVQGLSSAGGHTPQNQPSKPSESGEVPFINAPVNTKPKETHHVSWTQNLSFYFSQYCSATSIHGVQYLGERGRFIVEKIFWAVIITVVWGVCIMLITKTYKKWVTSPVIVTFATTETPISRIPFPAVTICPEAKIDPEIFNYTDVLLRKVLKKDITAHEEQYFQSTSLVCQLGSSILSNEGIKDGEKVVDDVTIDRLRDIFPYTTWDNISSVTWLGKEYESEDILPSIFSSDGICYSFNMLHFNEIFKNPEEYLINRTAKETKSYRWSLEDGYPDGDDSESFPKRTFVSGLDGGLAIMFVTNSSYLDYFCNFFQGFKVTLHHPCELPNMDKHVRVPLDQGVFIAIKPKMITISEELKSYKPEERKCYLVNERNLVFFKLYTQQNCLDECLANYTFSKCGCVFFHMPKYEDTPNCGAGSLDCVARSKIDYLSSPESNCNCLPSCTSLEYDVEISQTDWHWREMFKTMSRIVPKYREENFDYNNVHVSTLMVYYKEMQFLTAERHELYGYVDFFSNTGGLLGLFIGFSVTSGIEILYFLTLRLACNIRKFGQRFWSGEPALINEENVHQNK